MYLKRLEIKGFKSFPTKTEIVFNEGITAIVGPNGSGKSNISDAIRWVLGEQSAKSLRGDKLEDVIFVGTESKKAMNYCEVAITLDNSDNKLDLGFSEVTIKRRAYRTGESEFFLNNKSCRLKDIKEILLDTGIGKDGYSIVEQGKVDEILSNNPVNRRKVFDEACGISKFRYKKQEAERNLKHTKENLERIDDIYIEIENQLKPLFLQQEKAVKYLEFNKKLKVLEVNSCIKEVAELEAELDELNKHSNLLGSQSNEIQKQKSTLEKAVEETNIEIENINDGINKSQDYINTIKSVISQKDAQVNLINEKIRNCKNEIERNKEETIYIKEKLNSDKITLEKLINQKYEKEKIINDLNIDIKSIESNNKESRDKIETINRDLENLKDEIINLLNNKQDATSKLSTLNANKENINLRKETIDLDIREIKYKIDKKIEEVSKASAKLEDKTKSMESLKNDEVKTNNDFNILLNKSNNIEKQIQDSKYSLNDYKSKLNIYIEMENHYEGFNKGVKEVLKNKNLQGIQGALGQVIEVPSKFEKSIEASLGAYMQNIITNDESSAKFAINYLKKNNLGRVTFLPMNIIKSNKIDTRNIKVGTSFIGIASDLIKFDDKYRNIIENILGRTIIIDNIDNAIKFAKENNHKFKVVTLDGEILNPGGSLTGGSLRVSGNILSRKRLINEYKEKIELLKAEIDRLYIEKNEVDNNTKIIKEKLKQISIDINSLDKEIIIENAELNKFKEEIKSLKISVEKLENEKDGLGSNLEYILEKSKLIKDDILSIDTKHDENKLQIESLTNKLKEYNSLYEDDKLKFDNLNLNLVKHNQIYESIIRDIQRISEENKTLENKYVQIEKSLNDKTIETSKLEEDIVIEETEKISLNKQLVDNTRSLETKKLSKESLKEKLEDLNKESKNIDRQYIDLKESLFKVESKIERLKSNREDHINSLFEKYEITLDQAIEMKDDNLDVDKRYLENIRKEIRNLGNVNLDSIKEYEHIKERHDFYSEQKKDLEQSIEVIEKLIYELEENMKKEFESNFNKINENFKFVYKRLFGGGNGELKIVDKNNILESDIEITAQPPGKKMKNLNLLSGGEKALTAISILFSIILAKPTPFCILDEIEAPLDDANIFRFGEFLKELSNDTQFISVTHRRGTMEAADYIYGVTMQEKAISKVLSLKLKEAEEIIDAI
ncbi:MAG: chromosome segregation protein SMC [Romboutsia timonensis]|uniref:chromosome segregation protein SMC n=1 Tax=Romboutsia timonensis TaxID=1776391 RepID=UPI002A74B300|nr:chromosome segregation protein SMC [Romboutsia timonensis]MDY3000940.1 chromosome segregation protein SMC [Romboutsia timonensis]